jgi:hypothetical protein
MSDYTSTVVVKVWLRGTSSQKRELEDRLAGKQWRVDAGPPDGSFPDDGADHIGTYSVGVPVDRGLWRSRQRAAVRQIEALADGCGLDLNPYYVAPSDRHRRPESLAAPLVHPVPYTDPSPGRRVRPKWYGCEVVRADTGFWRSRVFRWGLKDTGEVLIGPLDWARRHTQSPDLRAPYGGDARWNEDRSGLLVRQLRLIQIRLMVCLYAVGLCGGWASTASLWWEAGVPALAALALTCAVFRLLRMGDEGAPLWRMAVVALLTSGAMFALGVWFGLRVWGPIAAALLIVHGIRLLVRSRTKNVRIAIVSAVVALLPVVLPWVLHLGAIQYVFYGAAFRVAPEDMALARAHQVIASLKVFAVSSGVVLMFLALWGYALHYLRAVVTDPALATVYALAGVGGLMLALLYVVPYGPGAAGEHAVAEWRQHRVPERYLGVRPLPVCVTPLKPVNELPAYAREVEPRKVYAAFGVVHGEIRLWDPAVGKSFSVPASSVRALSAGTGEPGSRIPAGCP